MVEEKIKETESKVEEVKTDEKLEKKETKKVEKKKIVAKDKAVANGVSLRISPKAAIAICKVIKGKSPQAAVKRLEDVLVEKRVIPMHNREVGHKKGKGIAGARYPMNACKAIINLVKQIDANAVVNGIEDPVISIAMSNIASLPFRRGGTKAKRTHVYLEVVSKKSLAEKKIKGAKK